jgi:NuA3 HAT complex component NTO1
LYNKPGTTFYKAAQRLQISSETHFAELEQKLASLGVRQPAARGGSDVDAMDTSPDLQTSIGSLEPPLSILELLVSEDAIADDIELILKEDPLASLFNFELETLKPPPPPPPPPPPKPAKPKRERDRQAEKERRLAREAAAGLKVLDVSPGFRAPRTRKGTAAAAAFEAEAHAEGEDKVQQAVDPAEQHSRKEAAKQRSKGWKRGPLILPGQSEVPPIVDEVDKRQSFKMFDAGWILPENQKRGGRTAISRPAIPPPRKKMRTSSSILHPIHSCL